MCPIQQSPIPGRKSRLLTEDCTGWSLNSDSSKEYHSALHDSGKMGIPNALQRNAIIDYYDDKMYKMFSSCFFYVPCVLHGDRKQRVQKLTQGTVDSFRQTTVLCSIFCSCHDEPTGVNVRSTICHAIVFIINGYRDILVYFLEQYPNKGNT